MVYRHSYNLLCDTYTVRVDALPAAQSLRNLFWKVDNYTRTINTIKYQINFVYLRMINNIFETSRYQFSSWLELRRRIINLYHPITLWYWIQRNIYIICIFLYYYINCINYFDRFKNWVFYIKCKYPVISFKKVILSTNKIIYYVHM